MSLLTLPAQAAVTTYYWDPGSVSITDSTNLTGTWNATNSYWTTSSSGGGSGTYTATPGTSDVLVFTTGTTVAASSLITLTSTTTVGSLNFGATTTDFGTSKTVTLTGSAITLTSSQVTGTTGAAIYRVAQGTTVLNNDLYFVPSSGTQALIYNANSAGARGMTLNGKVDITGIQLMVGGANNAVTVLNGQIVGTGGSLVIGGVGSQAKITISGTNNAYTGSTYIQARLTVSSIANAGVNCSLGSGTAIYMGGTSAVALYNSSLILNCATDMSTNRVVNLTAYTQGTATITANGAGAATFTSDFVSSFTGAGSKQLWLNGTNAGNNTIAGKLADSSSASLSVIKSDSGKWSLGGANTYTGTTSVQAGELAINGSLAAASQVSVSSGATLSGSGVIGGAVTNDGTISGRLTFNNDVTIDVGGTAAAAAFNGNIVDNGSITSAVALQSGKTLSGSGSISGVITAASATINGSGLNTGAINLTGLSTLSGTTTSSGAITVASGTTSLTAGSHASATLVDIHGTLANKGGTLSGATTVGGVLNGHGTVDGALTISGGGLLAPSSSSDTTIVKGLLTVEKGGKISSIIDSASSYSTIVAASGVTIENDTTLVITLNVLLDMSSAITLIDNQSASGIEGKFNQVTLNGATYVVDSNGTFTDATTSVEYLLTYTANATSGDSYANDLVLSVVPEPSTWAMLVGGIGMLAGFRRMCRNQKDAH